MDIWGESFPRWLVNYTHLSSIEKREVVWCMPVVRGLGDEKEPVKALLRKKIKKLYWGRRTNRKLCCLRNPIKKMCSRRRVWLTLSNTAGRWVRWGQRMGQLWRGNRSENLTEVDSGKIRWRKIRDGEHRLLLWGILLKKEQGNCNR